MLISAIRGLKMDIIKSSVNNWIKIISVILAVFVFSFGEIALKDIENMFEYPDFNTILEDQKTDSEKELFDKLTEKSENIYSEISGFKESLSETEGNIKDIEETLDQLLEGQEISPDSETGQLKSKYQKSYVELQKEREQIKKRIADLNREKTAIEDELDIYQKNIYEKYEENVIDIQNRKEKAVKIKVLLNQLILLVILAAAAVVLYRKFKKTKYIYPVTAYSSAIALMIAQAVYIHSPFKLHYYVFIFIGITACIALIIWLVRNLTKINRKETLSIIKKNLASSRCPGCSSLISITETGYSLKGKNRFRSFIIFIILCAALIGNGSGIVIFFDNISDISTSQLMYSIFLIIFPWIVLFVFINIYSSSTDKKIPDPDQFRNNNCPVCGLELVKTCSSCKAKRHALLPYCNSCGHNDETEQR